MPDALKSRKFWLTFGSVVSVIVSQYLGVDIDPAAIAGLAGLILSYNIGQGWVDKTVAQEGIKAETDVTKAQLMAYVQRLQAELATYAQDENSPNGVVPLRPEITE